MTKTQYVVRGLLGLFLLFLCYFVIFLFKPTVTKQTRYLLKPGTSRSTFVKEVAQQGIIHHPLAFSFYIQSQGRNNQLKAGEYLFPKGASPLSIWRQVTKGIGLVYYPFTIVPGWTFRQMKNALQQAPVLKHTIMPLQDADIMRRLGQKDRLPEGLFFPETYYYTRGDTDIFLLKKAFQLMQLKMANAWQHRSPNLPYQSEYEALIAASLIEKEAYYQDEQPLIASVLVNRLRQGMLLQFDPTVIYGLGAHYDGKIYRTDLLHDTPFNTYRHKGLPPTPIAMPGELAIQAALHPAQNDYFYFVAKGNGAHQFSHSLTEHQVAVTAFMTQQKPFFNEAVVRRYISKTLSGASTL